MRIYSSKAQSLVFSQNACNSVSDAHFPRVNCAL